MTGPSTRPTRPYTVQLALLVGPRRVMLPKVMNTMRRDVSLELTVEGGKGGGNGIGGAGGAKPTVLTGNS